MTTFSTTIKEIKKIHEEVLEITLSLPKDYKFDIISGQFIIIKFIGFNRAYSILDYNEHLNEMKLAIKKVENGKGTTIIFDTYKKGTIVDISKPMGKKLIIDKKHKDIMLVATGIGIVPIYYMLKDLCETHQGKVTLLYGSRTLNDLYYNESILNIKKLMGEDLEYIPVLSREKTEGIHMGYITDLITKEKILNKHIYMCSSKQVAKSFKEKLEFLDFNINNFKHESN